MKKFAFITMAAAAGAMFVFSAQAGPGVVKASRDSQCHDSMDNKLVVPVGSVAKDFTLNGLTSGTGCTTGASFDFENFSIVKSTDSGRDPTIYSYDYRGGKTVEYIRGATNGPSNGSTAVVLKTLVLEPGTYYLGVVGAAAPASC